MKLFSKSLLISLTAGFFQASLPAKATPYIYTTGGFLDSNTRLCVREAKRIANASGFEVIEVAYDDYSEDGATIFGRNFSRKTSFTFRKSVILVNLKRLISNYTLAVAVSAKSAVSVDA